MPGKRENHLSWEEYYMSLALVASMRSKDPSNQVGACIVNEETHKVLSSGYNGLPIGMSDDDFDWLSTGEKTGEIMNIKDNFVVHAERNAILNYAGNMKDLRGTTMYVTFSPCKECAKDIVQAGIKKVVYLRRYSKPDEFKISNFIFKKAGVEVVPYNKDIDFSKEQVQSATTSIQENILSLSKKI